MTDLPERDPLTIPQIVAAKGREKLAMLTVYDAPSARAARRGGHRDPARRRLGRDDGLRRTEHALGDDGHDGPPHPRGLARRPARRRRRRHAVSLVPDRARARRRERRALPRRGRRRRRQGRGRTADPAGRRGDPRGGHPGHGPRRPDAAVVPQVRRLQGPGPRGRLGARDPRGRARPWPRRDASRSCSSACRRRWRPRSRATIPSRRSGSAPGPHCDGQVLVFHDVVGLTRDLRPKFVRRYADLSTVIGDAARAFAKDVKSGSLPLARRSPFGGRGRRRFGECTEMKIRIVVLLLSGVVSTVSAQTPAPAAGGLGILEPPARHADGRRRARRDGEARHDGRPMGRRAAGWTRRRKEHLPRKRNRPEETRRRRPSRRGRLHRQARVERAVEGPVHTTLGVISYDAKSEHLPLRRRGSPTVPPASAS